MIQDLLREQKNEITACTIYKRLSETIKDTANAQVLLKMSQEEHRHYQVLKKVTQKDVSPYRFQVFFFTLLTRFLGLTFGMKMLERSEDKAVETYEKLSGPYPQLHALVKDEASHEEQLIGMIDEEKLEYMGSVVLGLNDALVELTGALAGFTFAFQNTRLIAVTALITGISASFSMSASEYLSTRQESGQTQKALKAAFYTGIAYIFTVIALVVPYLLIGNPFVSLAVCLTVAVLIIYLFNYYMSVVHETPFRKRFLEMAAISLGVSALSFLIGILVKNVFGLEV